jgi:hypothetical protein
VHFQIFLPGFDWLRRDPRLLDMLGVRWVDVTRRFTLESVWTAWKDWEFGQKKEPSRWLTLMAWRILGRLGVYSI